MQARILRSRTLSLKRWTSAFEKRVSSFLADFGVDAERAWLAMPKDDDVLRIERLFSSLDIPARKDKLRDIVAAHFVAVHKDNVEIHAGIGLSMNLPDGVQMEILSAGGRRAGLIDLSGEAKASALEIVKQAREEGLGMPETARKLREAIPAGPWTSSKIRAEVISRTETQYAQAVSSIKMYEHTEGVESAMVIDARLGPTDADCEAINGTVMTFGEAMRAMDDEHPNGTRDVLPYFGRTS